MAWRELMPEKLTPNFRSARPQPVYWSHLTSDLLKLAGSGLAMSAPRPRSFMADCLFDLPQAWPKALSKHPVDAHGLAGRGTGSLKSHRDTIVLGVSVIAELLSVLGEMHTHGLFLLTNSHKKRDQIERHAYGKRPKRV